MGRFGFFPTFSGPDTLSKFLVNEKIYERRNKSYGPTLTYLALFVGR